MKKFGLIIVVFLLILILWHSGLFDDTSFQSGLKSGLERVVDWVERGTLALINALKPR